MLDRFNELEPYSLEKADKRSLLFHELKELTDFHRINCPQYRNVLSTLNYDSDHCNELEDIPFLPVRLFKNLDLKSIPEDEVFKIMTSSGTGGSPSRIFLNRDNAILQQKILLKLLGNYIGKKRLPMLVIDSPEVIRNRSLFPARGATIIGLEFAAKKMIFALDENMELNDEVVSDFLEKYGNSDFVIFGFTFMVWKHLYDPLESHRIRHDFSNGTLITGGGWKKLESQKVSPETFKSRGREICGIRRFMDHYGMAEQSGSIYIECECGHLHASIYSDIITRDPITFSPCKIGEPGIIQVVSVLPHSYPGHSLLTEDMGIVLGEDDCPCGRKGKYVKILGRIKSAELRGCSDTYANQFK
ncbi:MAG TPA: acyl-protein synthetase [Ruminococcus sp.]|nr:acyl-protein synthetase [Ruminococcus sp.]